ncbi:hypothetical protein A3SI_07359 [Nitritalea halalkaliphila LW7]|uniref:Outer membrane protein beta-barrel domain-containing protein n=1 Tax=Nitritalea halalkaliphila LW7 TaxID=1189621 RepID=I5C5J9_9BACT|nr:hypothetical protein [Nitritalea halalkaliphila]EIM77101.1 hypothetical protein A3SI_07359 [Nitritalea halalkaliphila LW7]
MKKFIFLGLFFMGILSLQAQTTQDEPHLAGIRLFTGFSSGGLFDEVGELVVPGIGLDYLYQVNKTPFYVGGGFTYARFGTEMTRRQDVLGGVAQSFRIRRNNNMITGAIIGRLMHDVGYGLSPFIEGRFGALHTYTRSRIRENRLAEPISSGTEQFDWAAFYEVGAGLNYAIPQSTVKVELSMTYFNTLGELDFLTRRDAIYSPEGDLALNVRRSVFLLWVPR